MWHDLHGTAKQYAGTAGTVTLGPNEVILYITAWSSSASATLSILGGPSITIPQSTSTNPVGIWQFWIEHTLFQSSSVSSTVVFTNTTHYFVHTVKLGNT